MVRDEVEVGGEIKGQRDIVEAQRGESVSGLKHTVEVVGVPVVSNEREYRHPEVRFERVAQVQGKRPFRRQRIEHGLQ